MVPAEEESRPTSGRRARNAASQRIYRARQKARLEQLERLAVEALAPSGFSTAPLPAGTKLIQPQQQLLGLGSRINEPLANDSQNVVLSSHDILSIINSCSERERQIFRWILVKERFSIRNVIKFGLIVSGRAMDVQTFESADDLSTRSWLEKVGSTVGNVDMKAVAADGIRLLARLNVPWDQMMNNSAEDAVRTGGSALPTQSDLHVNRIWISRESLASAMFANASHLRVPLDDVLRDEAEYPSKRLDDTKPDLVPTSAQLAIPHHPCFDVIPWPLFRSNICLAIAQDPPLIDDEELCLDIMNEGIRCWGTSTQSLGGRGNGAPWDARSWEATPWFLEKWEFLTGGKDSDIWKNSAWWRSMR